MEEDEVQAPAPHRQNSLCPLSGPFYNIYLAGTAWAQTAPCAPPARPVLPATAPNARAQVAPAEAARIATVLRAALGLATIEAYILRLKTTRSGSLVV